MQSSRKQPSRRLEKREDSRHWLLIPALCAAVILAVVLIVELNKPPQVLPDNSNTTPVSHDQPTTPDPEPEPTPEPIPELLTLVNPWNQVPEDWTVDLVTLPNGLEIDKRCYDALMDMIDGCYDAGLTPVICSAYRTQDFQQTLYDNKVSEWMEQGYSREEAREKAGHQVAVPGTSEHQTGLALDIVAAGYQILDEEQEDTAEQKWLMENSWKYGFILRYPSEKSDITGIGYEPWHYRYVGKAAAADIYRTGVCLEEYLSQEGPEAELAPAQTIRQAAPASGSMETAPQGAAAI